MSWKEHGVSRLENGLKCVRYEISRDRACSCVPGPGEKRPDRIRRDAKRRLLAHRTGTLQHCQCCAVPLYSDVHVTETTVRSMPTCNRCYTLRASMRTPEVPIHSRPSPRDVLHCSTAHYVTCSPTVVRIAAACAVNGPVLARRPHPSAKPTRLPRGRVTKPSASGATDAREQESYAVRHNAG